MALDPSFIGQEYPATRPYEVSKEKIREFADAIGDDSPLYRDSAAAREAGYSEVIAPPTFAIILALSSQRVVIDDPQLGLDFSRVVHGKQDFAQHRAIQAGDQLVTRIRVADIAERAGSDFLTVTAELATTAGEPVCTATSLLVARAPEGGEQ